MVFCQPCPEGTWSNTTAVPDAVLRATAEELSLALWGRRPLAMGDAHPLVTAWLAYGGN